MLGNDLRLEKIPRKHKKQQNKQGCQTVVHATFSWGGEEAQEGLGYKDFLYDTEQPIDMET